MKKIILKFIAPVVMFAIIVTTMAIVAHANHDPFGGDPISKVTICHFDNGQGGKYTANDVSITSSGAPQGGHEHHDNDIIPPYHWLDSDQVLQSYPGQNWDGDTEAIWESNCASATETVDVCPNIDGDQATVPDGMHVDDTGNCVNITDVCPNDPGVQTNENECTPPGPQSCDLSGVGGSVTDNGTGDGTANAEFHNGGGTPITVTFGSYQTYSPYTPNDPNFDPHGTWLTTQTLFDHQTLTIPPCSSVTFQINVPNCSYQIDLYKDGVLNWDVPFPDGFTLYSGDVFGQGNMCTQPPVDMCKNLEGNQNTVPQGMHVNTDGNCVPDEVGGGCNVNSSSTIVSDTTNTDEDGNAFSLSFLHPGWTANIPSAIWIWATNPVASPTTNNLTKTFTKTFNIVGTPTAATLDIAADNFYTAKINGVTVGSEQTNDNNFQAGTQDNYNVLSSLHTGSNTLEITVTNEGVASTDPASNPAGLLYKLSINNNECVTPPPTEVTVTVVKYIEENGIFPASSQNTNNSTFPLTSTWTAANLNAGAQTSGDFSLGPVTYSATSSAMTSGAAYSVVENNVATSCTADNAGQYYIDGYKIGNTESDALASAPVSTASLTNITSNKFIIVVNKLCGEVLGDETVKVHVYKYLGNANSFTQVADNASDPAFSMTSSWDATNTGAGSGSYVLGTNDGGASLQFSADTVAMSSGADYTTAEVTDGNPTYAALDDVVCTTGKYRLAGYKSSTVSLADAEAQPISQTAPSFTDLTSDAYVIVINTPCVTDNGGSGNSDEPEPSIVKDVAGDLVAGGDITYTLTVTENSDINSANLVVTDSFPAGITYVSDDAVEDADTVFSGNTLTWTIPSLDAHQSATLTIHATIDENAEGSIINTATITGHPGGDSNEDNNSDSADLNVGNEVGVTDTDNGGGGSSHHSSSHRSSSGLGNNGEVLGEENGVGGGDLALAQTNPPAGEVLGAEVGLPRTGGGDVTMNILVLALSGLITLLGSVYLLRKKTA